jgi:hypothetical protein
VSLANELEAESARPGTQGPRCSVCVWVADHPTDEDGPIDWPAIFASATIKTIVLFRHIRAQGYPATSPEQVKRHRRGECRGNR